VTTIVDSSAVDSLTPGLPVTTIIDSPTSAPKTNADSSTQGSDGASDGAQDTSIATITRAQDTSIATITRAQNPDSNLSLLPSWLTDAATHLRAASHSPEWAELVDKLVAFEISVSSMVCLLPFL
jgi:hypothetical protein